MKAAFIRATGPADVIEVGELPPPEVGESGVLVRVRFSTVNPVDTYIRGGLVPFELPLPFVPGCDLAGEVEAVGPAVRRFRPGDRVWGSNQGLRGRQGTAAELAAVDERWLYPAPDGVSDGDLAAVALVGITAHLGLFRDAGLRAGETVFVSGGSGGVGSAVVQMAHLTGARVVTTAGSPAKAGTCKRLGADEVILHREQAVADRVRELCPGGVDVWYETLRQPDFMASIPLLAPRGRMIVMAGRDATPAFPVGAFYTRDCRLHGFAMFNATPDDQQGCGEDISRWMREGRLQANIDRVLPLERLAEAHRLQEESTVQLSGALAGKIVIKI